MSRGYKRIDGEGANFLAHPYRNRIMTRSHRTLRTALVRMSILFTLAVMIGPAIVHAQARNPQADANVARARAAMAPLAGMVGK